MVAEGLVGTARALIPTGRGRPRQADLRRAVSTAYYAAFHRLAQCCADLLVGVGPRRGSPEWNRVYRALTHQGPRWACDRDAVRSLDEEARTLARVCADLKLPREKADYDPSARFTKSDVEGYVETVEAALQQFRNVPRDGQRALAVSLLFRRRQS